MPGLDLRDSWRDLLGRRPAFAGALEIYGATLEAWAVTSVTAPALDWSGERCRASWQRGVPLLAASSPTLPAAAVEPLLDRAIELAAGARPDTAPALARLVEAWDGGDVTPSSLLPRPGRVGSLDGALGLDADVLAYLATACLRPLLAEYFARCRVELGEHDWELGSCPLCGGPPGFADIVEGGGRRLCCHLCGADWSFARLRCPFCGNDASRDLGRLEPEALSEQGYFLATCAACGAYLKELDRRARWNGGPALLEDWGSPHLDLVATRAGYWRPLAPVILGSHAAAD